MDKHWLAVAVVFLLYIKYNPFLFKTLIYTDCADLFFAPKIQFHAHGCPEGS
jgi:hypothetical protein